MLTGGIGCGNIMLTLNDSANHPSASGGIGRLAGFRCQCSQGRAGSTPASRTNKKDIRKDVLFVLSAEPFCRDASNGESGETGRRYRTDPAQRGGWQTLQIRGTWSCSYDIGLSQTATLPISLLVYRIERKDAVTGSEILYRTI